MPRILVSLALLLLWSFAVPVSAAPPVVNHLFPAGGGRGQTVKVVASGTFERWPIRTWVDEPGIVFEPESQKGKFIVRVNSDTRPGPRLVRFFDEEGSSTLRPFVISTLPECIEEEPNNELEKTQKLSSLPTVVNGRLGRRGDVDAFEVSLTKGQTLVAALDAQDRLGSPMDGVLQIVSDGGFVLEQSDDSARLDPILAFTAPADGRFFVRLFAFPSTPDSSISFAGGDAFIYRLTLTASGYFQQVMPLAIEAGRSVTVEAVGWNLPENLRILNLEPTASLDRVRAWHPRLAGDVELPVATFPCLVEDEPGTAKSVQEVPIPSWISGRIDRKGDEDQYRVTLKKGETCRIEVESRSLLLPFDAVIVVRDETGRVIAEHDNTARRSRNRPLSVTAPRDGSYEIRVRDLTGQGGPQCAYLLRIERPRPDFALNIKEENSRMKPGSSGRITVNVVRRDGMAAPISLKVLGLPDDLEAAPATSEPKGASSGSVTLTLKAREGAKPYSGPIVIVGRSGGLERIAQVSVPDLEPTVSHIWLTVGSKVKDKP